MFIDGRDVIAQMFVTDVCLFVHKFIIARQISITPDSPINPLPSDLSSFMSA